MKRCTRCKELKSYDDFHKNRTQVDGHASWCRSCQNKQNKLTRLANRRVYNLMNSARNKRRKLRVFQILCGKCAYENEYCSGRLEREHKQPVNRSVRIGGSIVNKGTIANKFDKEVLLGMINDKQLACRHHNCMKNNSTHETFIKDCEAIYLTCAQVNPVPLKRLKPSQSLKISPTRESLLPFL